VRRSE
jgi:hypothetical protein